MAAIMHLSNPWALALAVSLASAVQRGNAVSFKPLDLYQGCTTTLLRDGRWLVAGGQKGNGTSDDADKARLFDPTNSAWTMTGSLNTQRRWHVATLLSDGKVLVSGGAFRTNLASAETYDPVTGKWTLTGAMNHARWGHSATLMNDGRVLVAGGTTNSGFGRALSAEIYNPASGEWTLTGSVHVGRDRPAAVLLTNGSVLLAGGWNAGNNFIFSAELYEPSTGKWRMTSEMPYEARYFYSAELLTNGLALLTTSDTNAWEASKLAYDPATESWKVIGPRRPHFVSSTNLDRTLTIMPDSGSFLACEEIQLLIESADRFGVTNISLFRDGIKVAESDDSPMRFDITNAAAGTYVFVAKAAFANGLASTSAPARVTFTAPGNFHVSRSE